MTEGAGDRFDVIFAVSFFGQKQPQADEPIYKAKSAV